MSIAREKLSQKFEEEYRKLNAEQKKAVDHIEGPVMVIAGPGTGKTQILSARIGKILLSDAHVDPSNILCLTYTDSGALAMRRRLVSFIGADAYRVNIATFHAFCNEVIQDNLNLFEKTSLDPISDLEKVELLKEMIDAWDKDHPLKKYRGDVYSDTKNLESLFGLMKKEGWTREHVHSKIEEYIDDLQNRDEYVAKRAVKNYKKGDVRWDKIEEQKEKMERLRAASGELPNYQQMMRDRNRYDFDDMINWVIAAFETNEHLLRNYQEKYQYILVDEFQDTSGSQNKIVKLLINYWDKPNVFVVGDDDQSIYRFQGANVENMESFARDYNDDLLTVVLRNNYRSVQSVLDISKTLIGQNEERLVRKLPNLSKDLVASNETLTGLTHLPVVNEYATVREEMIDITNKVEALIGEGVEPASVGIIYRENKYGDELSQYFRLKKIPYYSRRSVNILQDQLITKIILVLQYLANEHEIPYSGDNLLFEILHLEWFDIPSAEIAKASMQVSELQYSGAKTSLRQWLYERSTQPPADLFDPGLQKNLKKASELVNHLITEVSNSTIQTLLEKVVREAGFLGYIMQHPDRNKMLQMLTGFYDYVKEETRRNPSLSLTDFMLKLDLMTKQNLSLPLVQISGNDKGVNLMTAHGSKGLEFDYIFFVGNSSSYWEKKRKPPQGFSFPDTLFLTAAQGNEVEELRRVFYVALTRAKRFLSISYPASDKGKEFEKTRFLVEILQDHNIPVNRIELGEDEIATFDILQFMENKAPELAHLDDELIDRSVNGFVMNVTALNNYLKCPIGFFYQNIIRIPRPKNQSAEFGSAIHYAVEQLFRKMQEAERSGKKSQPFPSVEEFIGYFEWWMRRHRESFTAKEFADRMEYGNEILFKYYNNYINDWNRIVVIESMFRGIVLDGVPLKGKMDKLEFTNKDVIVVDYKTGDPVKAEDKLKRPSNKLPEGGDYWRQAVFYKLLLDQSPKDWRVKGVSFDFIEPDKKKGYMKPFLEPDEIDTGVVTAQIKDTWMKIQRKEFYTGCGKEDCHWCNFVKSNNLAIALHDISGGEETEE